MSLKQNILIAVCGVMIVTGCKKELSTELPGIPSINASNANKVKKFSETVIDPSGSLSVTFNLTYDASDRLTLLADSANPASRFVYVYSPTSYTMDIITPAQPNLHEIFYLNSSLLVDSTLQYQVGGDTTTEKYLYNSSARVIREKVYDYTLAGGSVLDYTTDNTFDASGNITQSTTSTGTVTTYEYYSFINSIYIGMIYVPVASRNLEKKRTVTDGTTVETIDITYTFDSTNRVSTQTEVSDMGYTVVRKYTYF